MPDWNTPFEESPPADASAREIEAVLWGMIPDPEWFANLSQREQMLVLRAHCKEGGWYWPPVAKVLRRGINAPPNRFTAEQRRQQARMAADYSWSRPNDRSERTAPARAAFMSRFARQVDPEGRLDPEERVRLAKHASRAYFTRLALRSSLKRSGKL